MKVGYFLIFIFAILNFLGLKQTEFEIRQLDSTARILTTHAEAIQAAQEQPTLNAAAAAALTRADTQIAIASVSNENVAGEAKRLASLCNANIKEKSITASVSNDAVLEEMASSARQQRMHRTALHIFRSKTICWLRTTGIRGSGKSSVARLERKLIFIAELRYKRLHVPASVAA